MARVVVVGIDGLDADLLRVYGPSLPHLRRLMLESPFLELTSSFPPETVSSWASIYTGLNPGNHGMLDTGYYSLNALQEVQPRLKIPQGETFWDIAGQMGKRVCVVNPLLAYPAWQVNGVMVSLPPVGIKGSGPSVTPEEAAPVEPFPSLLNSAQIPTYRQLKDFSSSLYAHTLGQAERALELFQREPWDVFFVQLDALDHVQHVFWRYSDPGDPAYPGRNKHSERILDFYRLFDTIVGRFRAAMEQDCMLLVVSGHGHGRSCTQCLNLNEWLREQNLLKARLRSIRLLNRRYMLERARYRSFELLTQLHLQDAMPDIPQYFSGRQVENYTSCLIDQQATLAQVVELVGTSPFGGIILNRARIEQNGETYEHIRAGLLQKLTQLRLKGRPVIHWAKERENIYHGKYSQLYPDILFELRSDLGLNSSIYVSLTTDNLIHPRISGNHRMHGILLLGNLPADRQILNDVKEPNVMDVAPTILSIINVAMPSCDGQAVILPCATKLTT
ncbi:MAG: alkaline phosphatase family protein [Ktedonobacteraceae bacterium]|jgi:predicted AlkP superfamily phosphohydrolase/phosphomutase